MKNLENKVRKIRIIEVLIAIATIILMPKVIALGTAERGFKAVGGEYLFPVFSLLAIMILENRIVELRNKVIRMAKKRQSKKRNQINISIDTKDMTLQEIKDFRKSGIRINAY